MEERLAEVEAELAATQKRCADLEESLAAAARQARWLRHPLVIEWWLRAVPASGKSAALAAYLQLRWRLLGAGGPPGGWNAGTCRRGVGQAERDLTDPSRRWYPLVASARSPGRRLLGSEPRCR